MPFVVVIITLEFRAVIEVAPLVETLLAIRAGMAKVIIGTARPVVSDRGPILTHTLISLDVLETLPVLMPGLLSEHAMPIPYGNLVVVFGTWETVVPSVPPIIHSWAVLFSLLAMVQTLSVPESRELQLIDVGWESYVLLIALAMYSM